MKTHDYKLQGLIPPAIRYKQGMYYVKSSISDVDFVIGRIRAKSLPLFQKQQIALKVIQMYGKLIREELFKEMAKY